MANTANNNWRWLELYALILQSYCQETKCVHNSLASSASRSSDSGSIGHYFSNVAAMLL